MPKRQTRVDEFAGYDFGAPMRTALWYKAANHNTTTGIVAEATLQLSPFKIGRDCVLDRIAIETTIVGSAGNVIRLGIYHDDGRGYPGALLLDAGTVDGTAGPGLLTITISQGIQRGLYWVGGAHQAAAGTRATTRNYNGNLSYSLIGDQNASPNLSNASLGYSQTSVTGALPNPFTSTVAVAGQAMATALRASV